MFKIIFFVFLIFMIAHYFYRRFKFILLFKKTRQIFEGIKEDDIIQDGDKTAFFLEDKLSKWKYPNNLQLRRYNEACNIIINKQKDKINKNPIKILDIGCADAFLYKILSEKTDMNKFELYGIDISSERILLAKKRFDGIINIDFKNGNMENMHFFKSNDFDIIISIESLEHVIYPQKAIEEMQRILKPEGLFVLSVPSKHMEYFSRYNPLTWLEAAISFYYPSILPPFHDLYYPEKMGDDTLIHRSFTIQEIKNIMKNWLDLRIRPSDFAFEEFLPQKLSDLLNLICFRVKPLNGLGTRFTITATKKIDINPITGTKALN